MPLKSYHHLLYIITALKLHLPFNGRDFFLASQINLTTRKLPLIITTVSLESVKNSQKRIEIDLTIDALHPWSMGYYRSSSEGLNDI